MPGPYAPLSWEIDPRGYSWLQFLADFPWTCGDPTNRRALERQLRSRGLAYLGHWLEHYELYRLHLTVGPCLAEKMAWPNHHFLPLDPLPMLYLDNSDSAFCAPNVHFHLGIGWSGLSRKGPEDWWWRFEEHTYLDYLNFLRTFPIQRAF